ncbi:MAG TPA: MFS transporter [Streptosporangiaceae bacterium]|jgi:DHA3 family tetracycline resistance protein-like MFS transporter|nr:MFS transporter [Streptosporangiaceae bacterium]
MRLGRHPIRPYRLYLVLECGMSFLLGISYATITVYWVISGRLNPLQLLLLGTALELSYFLLQLPTGVLADLVSRRLCTLAGLFIVGLALIMQGLSPSFASLMGAQVVLGLGAALNNGAQEAWVADELAGELGDERMTSVYLRATQFGLIATVAGSLLSGVIALAGLNAPLLTGGSLICLLALGSAVVMPESNFRPARLPAQSKAAVPARASEILRQSRALLLRQTRSTHRAVVAVPGLVLLFGMTLFVGMWSESFDRLWGAFLLRDIRFPQLGGLHPAMWFSLFACAAAVLGLGATEVARRRTERLGPDSVAGGLLILTLAIGAAAVAMAVAHTFALVVGAYIAVTVFRPVLDPLLSGWMITRIEPAVRATALSAKDMFDSAGQIAGGPVIGVIGTLASIRIALLAGAAALAPAAACVVAASRRIRPRIAGTVADAEAAEAAAEHSSGHSSGQSPQHSAEDPELPLGNPGLSS